MEQNVAVSIEQNVSRVVVGCGQTVRLLLAALLAGGHVLLQDVPGTGKTTLCKAVARSIDARFSRIQFTPDLLPSDVTGLSYYNPKEGAFVFREGPAFCNVLLADEINRATPRTQSALLECMEERQITVDGVTRTLARPFFVVATQNPVETAGTFPLPEAQMDRFLMRLSMGLPSLEGEVAMLERFVQRSPLEELQPVCTAGEVERAQQACREVYVHPALMEYVARLCRATRESREVACGVSPRGTLALLRASQGYAMAEGRSFVTPEDVKAVAPAVLTHRLMPERASGARMEDVVGEALATQAVPTEAWGAARA